MKYFKSNPMYLYLMVLTISSTVGLYAWRTLFDNFAVNIVHLEGYHIGILQSIREIPGILSLLVVYCLLVIKEHRLSALSILILGIGVAATGFFPSFIGLAFTILVMSFGFHYYETTYQSLTLQYFNTTDAPIVFSQLRSFASLSNICAGATVFILASFLTFKQLYIIFGLIVIAASIWAFFQKPTSKNLVPQKTTMIIKKQYWLFYLLTFMAGARRQIFVAFAVFLLVKKFSFSVQEIAILFLINNIIMFFVSPLIGKCINKYGERRVLSLEYLALVIIFMAYSMVESKIIVSLLYVADHVFINFAIAIRTFFQKIAQPEDIAPSMAVGFTINHIAAVFLPAIGGLLWLINYRIVFVAGAILSFISFILVQFINVQLKKYS